MADRSTNGMSGCGACTLCCTVMKVAMDPPKPERTACANCKRTGCAIYADRPEPCRVFQCLWLWSQDKGDPMPAALRPDRCGVVIEINSAGYVVAHSHRPASWKREHIGGWLRRATGSTRVLIENGVGVGLLDRDGSTRPLHFAGVDRETNERLYVVDGERPPEEIADRILPGSAPSPTPARAPFQQERKTA
jgi:hypothetical protein